MKKKDKPDNKKKDKDVTFSHKFQAGGYSQMRKESLEKKDSDSDIEILSDDEC